MAITVKHKFVSAIPDAGDTTIVQPSNWNDDHDLVGTVPVANGGTGVTSSSGANSVVLRDANANITTNCLFEGFSSQAANVTTIVLTASSVQNWQITGSGGQTIKLPNATTLPNGALFTFNNNQSSGTIIVQNNSSTTVATINSGGYVTVILLDNSIAAGSWDRHDSTPSNVSWSTNTLDYAGSITSATWNGNTVQVNRGGTGATTLTGYVKGAGTTALTASSTIPTTDLSGTVSNAQLANSAITINGTSTSLGGSVSVGTVTGVTGTAPVVSSGGATPAISMAAANTTTNGYLTSTDWNTFNGKGSGSVTSVAATVPSFLSITGSPITTSGTLAITYSGTALPIANGGTAQSSFTTGYIHFGSFSTSSNLFWDNTNNFLGLGTTSAIISGARLNISAANGVGTGSLAFVNTGATTKKWQIGPDANGNFVVFNDANTGAYLTYGGTTWTPNVSDARLKNKVSNISNALTAINQLEPLTFYYKNQKQTGTPKYGFFAQNVGNAIPDAQIISPVINSDLEQVYTYDPSIINVYLVAAIKELSEKFYAYVASHS
jgi:hypothetical protein